MLGQLGKQGGSLEMKGTGDNKVREAGGSDPPALPTLLRLLANFDLHLRKVLKHNPYLLPRPSFHGQDVNKMCFPLHV